MKLFKGINQELVDFIIRLKVVQSNLLDKVGEFVSLGL
ncbi:hypothetical protein BCM20_001184 [Clostridium beijerinckii]|nr:hypothetical protein [Clostridium beijerinckii]NYC01229.1 hypothetical protein [Clostridium beijerinckii]